MKALNRMKHVVGRFGRGDDENIDKLDDMPKAQLWVDVLETEPERISKAGLHPYIRFFQTSMILKGHRACAFL